MKTIKFFLLNLFISVFIFPCYSQVWAPQGAEWYFHYQDFWEYPWTYYYMRAEGDTLINSIQCRQISRFIRHYDGSNEHLYPPLITYYNNEKVYYLQNGQFYILYDFSANVGDSWTSRNPYEYYGWPLEDDTMTTYTVDSVRYVTIMGQTLKQLWLSSPNYWDFGVVSQRIGCLHFMLPGEWAFWDPPVEGSLRCYTDEEFSYTPFTPCDSIITGLNDHQNITDDFEIFPNPFYNDLTLITDKRIKKMEICDIWGNCRPLLFMIKDENLYDIDTYCIRPGFNIIILHYNNNQIKKIKIFKYKYN